MKVCTLNNYKPLLKETKEAQAKGCPVFMHWDSIMLNGSTPGDDLQTSAQALLKLRCLFLPKSLKTDPNIHIESWDLSCHKQTRRNTLEGELSKKTRPMSFQLCYEAVWCQRSRGINMGMESNAQALRIWKRWWDTWATDFQKRSQSNSGWERTVFQ